MIDQSYIQRSFWGWVIVLIGLCIGSCTSKKSEKVAENEYYVCSMDPQVMEKKPGPCPICKMPLTKAVISNEKYIKLSAEQEKLANIRVDTIGFSEIGQETLLTGSFTVNQNKTEQISARVPGRLERLYHKIVGENVHAGDRLYDLYSPELLAAQEEYLLALEKGKILNAATEPLITAAKTKLLLWGMSEAQIYSLRVNGHGNITTTVYSKSSGVIYEIPMKEGDYVQEGSEIYKLVDLHSLWVEAQLYAGETDYLRDGQTVDIVPASFPEDHIAGSVIFANPELEANSKINLIRIEISNGGLKYAPGTQAYVTLKSNAKRAIVIPIDAVIQNAKNNIVWVKRNDGGFEPRQVILGVQKEDKVEVRFGLHPKEAVVVSGAYLLNSEFIFKRGATPMEDMQNMKM